MKKFLSYLITISFLTVLIIAVIKYFVPYYWGNTDFATKAKYLKYHPSEYNTFFFGASAVHHQINPKVFDSVVNSVLSEKINSFNLGSPATFPPQSYYLYEHFLKHDADSNIKYCFIELKNISIPSRPIRDEYWQNLGDVNFLFKVVSEEKDLTIRQKIAYYRHTIYRYVKNSFAYNQLGTYQFSENFYDPMYLGAHKDGFLSLDYQYEHTTHEKNREGMNVLRKKLLDPKLHTKKITSSEVDKMFINQGKPVSKTHLKRINNLIKISKERGITLVFFISPKSTNQHLIDLYKKVPVQNRLEFSTSPQFEELFIKDNLYDAAHANEQGAKIYSAIFAKDFAKLLNNSKK